MHIRNLSTLECTALLSANRFAHLACASNGEPYVMPIYVAYAGNHLYAFSMPGKKIDWMRTNPRVSVVMEEHGHGREWKSVIANGRYEELPDGPDHEQERDHAWLLLSKHNDWWEPGALKPRRPLLSDHLEHVFFRISIDTLSGRQATEA